MTIPDSQQLVSLVALRQQLRESMTRTADTLLWFARANDDGIPPNTWTRLDRPGPHRPKLLSLPMEVWHGLLHLERAVRSHGGSAKLLRKIQDGLDVLKDRLTKRLRPIAKEHANNKKPSAFPTASLIAADHVYGTMSMPSAALILRAEVFPARFDASPSYVAGHVIFCGLRVAGLQAAGHRDAGVTERAPRIAVAAEGIGAVLTYIEHLRSRGWVFRRMAEELSRIASTCRTLDDATKAVTTHAKQILITPVDVGVARSSYLQLSCAKLAEHARSAASLILATKPFFRGLSKALDGLRGASASTPDFLPPLEAALRKASAGLSGKRETLQQQKDARDYAERFALELGSVLKGVARSTQTLLEGSSTPLADARDLGDRLERLRILHLPYPEGGPGTMEPSIEDMARYRFLLRLCHLVKDASDEGDKNGLDKLRAFVSLYEFGGDEPKSRSEATDKEAKNRNRHHQVRDVLHEFGKRSVCQSMVTWWQNYAECFSFSSTDCQQWIALRHKSFGVVTGLLDEIEHLEEDPIPVAAQALAKAAEGFDEAAREVLALLRKESAWCSALGRQLLLESASGASEHVDAVELASAMWLADKMHEPWPAPIEETACREMKKLQRRDGGFMMRMPEVNNRRFSYFAPSIRTILMLARFLDETQRHRGTALYEERMGRWQAILESACHFVIASGVGREPGCLFGWHTDRFPEADRIDCRATAQAVVAIATIDEVLTSRINDLALAGLKVEYRKTTMDDYLPLDCCRKDGPYALRLIDKIAALRRKTADFFIGRDNDEQEGAAREIDDYVVTFHGPPGTGKTFTQSVISGELGWPIATISIGHFLQDGQDRVGKAAVDLFARLSHVSKCCLVFDEFDEMIANRAGTSVGQRSFAPLTPTMLPLLAEFRETARDRSCLVAFTTNYIYRVDPAAVRGGRVDEQQRIDYPDVPSRILVLLSKVRSNDWSTVVRLLDEAVWCTGLREYASLRQAASALGQMRTVDFKARRPASPEHYLELALPNGTFPDLVKDEVEACLSAYGRPGVLAPCVDKQWLEEAWQALASKLRPARQQVPAANVTAGPARTSPHASSAAIVPPTGQTE